MAREARRESPTGYYHVMMRGNNKEMIFSKPIEKQYFLKLLRLKKDEENISIIAYCLMDNHVHLLLHSDIEVMSDVIKWINTNYAGKYNYKHDRIGHVFQDRYKSQIINSDEHLLEAVRYIHNNPVKANIVPNVLDYPWSSYRSYISNEEDKLLNSVEKQMILGMFSGAMEEFIKFHLSQDQINEEICEFIDTKQDIELVREKTAQIIITNYCEKYGISDAKGFYNRKDILDNVVFELLKKSKLSHRKISELTNTTRGIVHNIAKKLS